MTEPTVEYNKNYENLKFIRLRGSYAEDLIGIVSYKEECIVIKQPLRVEIETLFEEGRQILSMQEYLPQTIVKIQEVEIPSEDILFVTPVNEEFYEQYEYVCEFFYNDKKPEKKTKVEKISEATEKVVSILEAMQAKKDKPVH